MGTKALSTLADGACRTCPEPAMGRAGRARSSRSETASRRDVLRLIAGAFGIGACQPSFGQPAEHAAFIGVETSASTGHSAARLFAASGETLGMVPLNYRAHGMASFGQSLVVFPRRPGNRFAVVDMATLQILSVITAPEGRHFYGHGAFSADGQWLLVTENDLTSLEGRVGVYDMADGPRRAGEISLPRPGPHEIIRGSGGDFFVALGGLETHPDYGRTALNLRAFQSEVVRLDFERTEVTSFDPLPNAQGVSIRHMAQDNMGRLIVGGQKKDPRRAESSGVLWILDGGGARELQGGALLGGYVSSVAAQGRDVLVSSKESGKVLQFRDATLHATHETLGASGLGFLAHAPVWSGYTTLNGLAQPAGSRAGWEFDNHGHSCGRCAADAVTP